LDSSHQENRDRLEIWIDLISFRDMTNWPHSTPSVTKWLDADPWANTV